MIEPVFMEAQIPKWGPHRSRLSDSVAEKMRLKRIDRCLRCNPQWQRNKWIFWAIVTGRSLQSRIVAPQNFLHQAFSHNRSVRLFKQIPHQFELLVRQRNLLRLQHLRPFHHDVLVVKGIALRSFSYFKTHNQYIF